MHTPFIGNLWGSDSPEIEFLSRFYKGDRILQYVNATLRKYDWAVPLRYKKGLQFLILFKKF